MAQHRLGLRSPHQHQEILEPLLLSIVFPVICHTKYMFCVNGERDCSPRGHVLYLQLARVKDRQQSASPDFGLSLLFTPIYLASLLRGCLLQSDPSNTAIRQELS